MHTEHLQNVRVGIVFGGWLIAAAVASLVVFVLAASGIADMTDRGGGVWAFLAVLLGFWAGGVFTGLRAVQAPVLHGVAIGIASLVAWVAANLLASALPEAPTWTSLTPGLALGLLLAQMAAAVIGALMGYNIALRGRPGLTEHEPVD